MIFSWLVLFVVSVGTSQNPKPESADFVSESLNVEPSGRSSGCVNQTGKNVCAKKCYNMVKINDSPPPHVIA